MVNDVSIIELAFANLLDLIPMISNTDENVDPALIRIYERNAAIVNDAWEISPNEKLVESRSQQDRPENWKYLIPIYRALFQVNNLSELRDWPKLFQISPNFSRT